jgi:alcohol dehydrogenase class IV
MQFEFATATRIVFGPGMLKEVGTLAAGMGRQPLVVTGHNSSRAAVLFNRLTEKDLPFTTFSVSGEPTVEVARTGVRMAQEAGCDMVIAFGGGSVLDTGKAIAALLTNPGDPLDYLEVIGQGKKLSRAPAPFIAIPTTAGTGSEVTSNAVLASPEHHVKVSLRSPLMLAKVALVDPLLTHSAPPDVTAQTGLDALTQVMEPYVSNKANPLTDAICREGMSRAARSLRRAWENGDDAEAREDMALVGLFGGLALSNAKLGAVHGFAGPIGGMYDAPHGAICARLLPVAMAANVAALRSRAPDSQALRRYDEIGQLLTGKADAKAEDGIEWVTKLCEVLHVPTLSAYGMQVEDFPTIVEKAAVASSMQGNPIKLTPDELTQILIQAQ